MRTSLILGLFGRDAAGSCGAEERSEILAARDPRRVADLAGEHLRHIKAGLDITARPAAVNALAAAFSDRAEPLYATGMLRRGSGACRFTSL